MTARLSTSGLPSPTPKVSINARCGPEHGGSTCLGSKWGDCCSQYSYCGRTGAYCGIGCQDGFGFCNVKVSSVSRSSSSAPTSSLTASSSAPLLTTSSSAVMSMAPSSSFTTISRPSLESSLPSPSSSPSPSASSSLASELIPRPSPSPESSQSPAQSPSPTPSPELSPEPTPEPPPPEFCLRVTTVGDSTFGFIVRSIGPNTNLVVFDFRSAIAPVAFFKLEISGRFVTTTGFIASPRAVTGGPSALQSYSEATIDAVPDNYAPLFCTISLSNELQCIGTAPGISFVTFARNVQNIIYASPFAQSPNAGIVDLKFGLFYGALCQIGSIIPT